MSPCAYRMNEHSDLCLCLRHTCRAACKSLVQLTPTCSYYFHRAILTAAIPRIRTNLTFLRYFLRANGEVILGGTAYHNNSDTKVSADDTRHILEVTRQLVPSLAVSINTLLDTLTTKMLGLIIFGQ